MPGARLITIEGVDGAGKTTLAGALERELRARGIDVALLREPGGVELSERIRALVTEPGLTVGGRAEALLYAAARAQLAEQELQPRLDAGQWLLLDRYVDSSLAYQGVARHLGVQAVAQINQFATQGLVPDRTLLLDLTPALGRARQDQRAGAPDRMERSGEEFFADVARGYRELARRSRGRIRVIDAGRSPEAVLTAALAELADLLP